MIALLNLAVGSCGAFASTFVPTKLGLVSDKSGPLEPDTSPKSPPVYVHAEPKTLCGEDSGEAVSPHSKKILPYLASNALIV